MCSVYPDFRLFILICDALKTLFLKTTSLANIIITIRVNGIKFSVSLVRVNHKRWQGSNDITHKASVTEGRVDLWLNNQRFCGKLSNTPVSLTLKMRALQTL